MTTGREVPIIIVSTQRIARDSRSNRHDIVVNAVRGFINEHGRVAGAGAFDGSQFGEAVGRRNIGVHRPVHARTHGNTAETARRKRSVHFALVGRAMINF